MRVLSRKLVGSRSVVLAMALSSVLAIVGCASSNSSSTGSNITATPTLSPGAGTYKVSQPVTIADTTQGAVLYCTTDGTTPTTSSPQCAQPTTIFKTEFLQAIAVAPGKPASAVASAGYTISPDATAAPTFNPAGGSFAGTQMVTISDSTPGANIFYTLDGTSPTTNSSLYTGPVAIAKSATLSALAAASGFVNSPIVTATYTIQAALPTPTVSSIAPTFANAGGVAFTLMVNGTNFVSGSTVQWNGTALTTTYVGATQLTAAVPANLIASAGTANVNVTQASGVSGGATFTINSAGPAITALSPSSGTAGASVSITGSNFTGATAVSFGTTPATSFTVNSATSITAVAPAGTGTVDVKVVSPIGTSATAATDQFTYSSTVPTLTSISPTAGLSTGGTSVTITGTNFTGATAVNFGSIAATSFTVNSSTSITAVSPAGTGTVDVTVVTPNGPSTTSAADQFTYSSTVPTVTSISPATGPAAGGTSVTVTGTNFTGATAVNFGTTPAASFTVNSGATSVTAVSPAGTGTVDITVVTPSGPSATAAADQFVYTGITLTGTVLSGALPINGATVQMYAAGTTGYGIGSSALTTVPAAVTTDNKGAFSLQYFCPASGAPGDQMYLVATGGDTGNGPNTSIALMAAMGTCSKLPPSVIVNEVTTIASAYALSAFATINSGGGITVGAPALTSDTSCNAANNWLSNGPETCNYTGLVHAFQTVNNLVDGTGTARTHTPDYQNDLAGDPNILNNSTVPTARINALADMLASCVESSASTCGGGLFTAAATTVSKPGAPAPVTPVDTLQAALNIAQNPGNNVPNLLNLVSATPPYSITSPDTGSMPLVLSSTGAPTDLTLALTFTGAGLGIAPTVIFPDGSQGGPVAGGMGIDAAGNVWVGGGIFTSNTYSKIGMIVSGFNALGAPLPQMAATTLNSGTPTYGGLNPEPTASPLRGLYITALAIDQSNNLWVNDTTNAVVEVNTIPSVSAQTPIIVGTNATSLTIDGQGNAWYINQTGLYVAEVTANGAVGVTGQTLPFGYYPYNLAFDANFGLWATSQNPNFGGDVLQLNTSDGTIAYDPFATSSTSPAYITTIVADNSGFIYGCDDTGLKLNQIQQGSVANTYSITTGRACGTQLVLDGQGHIFSVLNAPFGIPGGHDLFQANIDEFTTGGTLISPLANGYTGTSSAETPTLTSDQNWISGSVIGTSAAMDGSGNLWVVNADTFGAADPSSGAPIRGNALVEYIGIGAPVLTPASTALNGMLGVRP